jgi:hypothetical protein
MDSSVHPAIVDPEIVNENYVVVDSEIGNDGGVVSSFTPFLCLH